VASGGITIGNEARMPRLMCGTPVVMALLRIVSTIAAVRNW
jgi:hypothetical protein